MKAIMISIKPKWCAKIMNGEKTIEVRKRFPKDYRGWVYIYCTKEKYPEITLYSQENEFGGYMEHTGNGKVIGRFWCGQVEEFYEFNNDLCEKACIGRGEILDYLGDENGYAIHISKLEIYDKPKELREFSNRDPYPYTRRLTRAPQSWQYVEVEE